MAAEPLLKERYDLDEASFVEMVIYRVPRPVPGSAHLFKYRLAYVVEGECVLRYDNETGKGDHRHWRNRETLYQFTDTETLLKDFRQDIETMRRQK
jgi:Family of unknown function (DUF6516)